MQKRTSVPAPEHRTFLPAAGRDWLLPLYDPFSKLLGAASAHRRLIAQARLTKGQRVLDVGCGTGNLTLLAKTLHPDVEVVGLDPDPKALQRAESKARSRCVDVRFERGFADAIPHPDQTFDCVLTAFMLHHLKSSEMVATLRDVRRVLKLGGRLEVLDFARHDAHVHGLIAHLIPRRDGSGAAPGPGLIEHLREAGFAVAGEVARSRNLVGRVAFHQGVAVGQA